MREGRGRGREGRGRGREGRGRGRDWKELSYIEILDNSTEAHYDLVFGDFRFDSAHFIHDETRDILLVAFPLEETQSTERAREFVTAAVLHLAQTTQLSLKDDGDGDQEEEGRCTPSARDFGCCYDDATFVD